MRIIKLAVTSCTLLLFSNVSEASLLHTGYLSYDYTINQNLTDVESIEANQWGITGFLDGDIYSLYYNGTGGGWVNSNLTTQYNGTITDYATWGNGAFFLGDGSLRHTGNLAYNYTVNQNLTDVESIDANKWGITGFHDGDIYSLYYSGVGFVNTNLTAQYNGIITDYASWGNGAFFLSEGKLHYTGNTYDYSTNLNLPDLESIETNQWGITGFLDGDIYSLYYTGSGWVNANITTQYDGNISDYATWGNGAFFLEGTVPEPQTFALLCIGLAGMGYQRKKLKKT